MNSRIILSGASLLGGVFLLAASPKPAAAHVCMDYPVSRVGAACERRSPQKMGPCPVARTADVTVFRPGETIKVKLRETVNHPGHYRIAFDPNGERFVDPVALDDRTQRPYVLVDHIVDAEDALQEVEITFPNVATENGTLQLVQVMADKGGNGFGGANGGPNDNDDLYYSCADIALRPAAADAGTEGKGDQRNVAIPMAAALAAVAFIRRRRD